MQQHPPAQLVRVDLIAHRKAGRAHVRRERLLDHPCLEGRAVAIAPPRVGALDALTRPDGDVYTRVHVDTCSITQVAWVNAALRPRLPPDCAVHSSCRLWSFQRHHCPPPEFRTGPGDRLGFGAPCKAAFGESANRGSRPAHWPERAPDRRSPSSRCLEPTVPNTPRRT